MPISHLIPVIAKTLTTVKHYSHPLFLAVLLMFSGTCSASDAIDDLVNSLNKLNSYGLWSNGIFNPILLPESASIQQVATKFLGDYHYEKYSIVEIKDVTIDSAKFSAVLIETSRGREIVLFRYMRGDNGWWSKMFYAK